MSKKFDWDDFFTENADAGHVENGDASPGYSPIELNSDSSIQKAMGELNRRDTELASLVESNLEVAATKLLPFASEAYNISRERADYLLVPTTIVPVGLPNRNKTAFPRDELARFNPTMGNLAFKTWVGKPVYVDHVNRDLSKSIGMVLDTAMVPMSTKYPNLKMWKVVSLLAIDRSKRPEIANLIMSGARDSYSMGANVVVYSCSVCGATSAPGSRDLPCGTNHVTGPRSPYKVIEVAGKSILGHRNAHGISGFEVSTVPIPAWPSAVTGTDRIMRLGSKK